MILSLIHPPYGQQGDLFGVRIADLLAPATGQLRFTSFQVAVAFTKLSGLGRLAPALQTFRSKGGNSTLISGIDVRGTSSQALEESLQLFDRVFIHFDSAPNRTFHPKLYILKGVTEARVYIGSNNMTAGGLYTNYELSIVVDLDLTKTADKTFLDDVDALFNTQSNNRGASQRLTPTILNQLILDGLLYDEALPDPRPHVATGRRHAWRRRSSTTTFANAPLMPSAYTKFFRRKTSVTNRPAPLKQSPLNPITSPAPFIAQQVGFWKRLSGNDVSMSSSPGQIIIPKQFLNYFPPLTPTPDPNKWEAFFAVEYLDASGTSAPAPDSRLILYVPKPGHPRPNLEYRFTFRERSISSTLSAGDVLVFELRQPPYHFRVWHVPAGLTNAALYTGNWATL